MNTASIRHSGGYSAVLFCAVIISLLLMFAGVFAVLGCWYPRSFWAPSGVLVMGAYALAVHLVLTGLLLLPWRSRSREGAQVLTDVAKLLWVVLSAALFSLSVLAEGRPVALVYAVDRVVMVRAGELRSSELRSHALVVPHLRWSGPLPMLAIQPSNDVERLDSIQLALSGFDLPQRPSRWQQATQGHRNAMLHKALRLDQWQGDAKQTKEYILADGVILSHYLPLDGAKGDWVLAGDDEWRIYVPLKVNDQME